MKNGTLTALAGLLALSLPLAAEPASYDSLQKDFAAVRTLELPARVASAVSAAAPGDRQAVTRDAVRAGLTVSPASAPMIVGAVARANPNSAADAAASAASLQPKETAKVVRAAIGAAPSQVESIVTALVRAKPSTFYTVGMNASDVAPKSSESIATAIASASPALKTLIAVANPTGTPIKTPVALGNLLKRVNGMVAILTKPGNADTLLASDLTSEMTAKLPTSMGALAESIPTVGPPYTDGSPTPGEIPAQTGTFEAPVRPPVYSSP